MPVLFIHYLLNDLKFMSLSWVFLSHIHSHTHGEKIDKGQGRENKR